jgi:hypothetical protein
MREQHTMFKTRNLGTPYKASTMGRLMMPDPCCFRPPCTLPMRGDDRLVIAVTSLGVSCSLRE